MDTMTKKHIALAVVGTTTGAVLGAGIMHYAMQTPEQRAAGFPVWGAILIALGGLGLLAGGAYLLTREAPKPSIFRRGG